MSANQAVAMAAVLDTEQKEDADGETPRDTRRKLRGRECDMERYPPQTKYKATVR